MKRKNSKITQDKVVYFINYVFLTFMLIIVLYPIIYIISCSFSSGNALMSGKVKLLPVDVTLNSYKAHRPPPESLPFILKKEESKHEENRIYEADFRYGGGSSGCRRGDRGFRVRGWRL